MTGFDFCGALHIGGKGACMNTWWGNMHTSSYGMLLSLSFNNGAVCFFIFLFYCITKFYFCWSADVVSTFWSLDSNHHLCNYLVSGKFCRKGAEIGQDVTC